MYALSIILLLITAVIGVFSLARPELCSVAIITGILGALLYTAAGRARKRRDDDRRAQAIIEAIQRGQQPPTR